MDVSLLPREGDEDGEEDEEHGEVVVGAGFLVHDEDGEACEDEECDGFLDDFELGEGEGSAGGGVADAIGGDLEGVFGEGDEPGEEDGGEERPGVALAEVVVPREGHADVGAEEEKDGGEAAGEHGRAVYVVWGQVKW